MKGSSILGDRRVVLYPEPIRTDIFVIGVPHMPFDKTHARCFVL